MIVSMDNHYTLNSKVFTVLTVTKAGECCVLGHTPDGQAHEFRADGTTRHGYHVNHILVEVIPYSDFKIDEPVVVRDHDDSSWERRHFAGVKNGNPLTWCNGSTKWASGGLSISWLQCRKPSLQELG